MEFAERERKEAEKLKEKINKFNEVVKKAKEANTIEELDQLEKEAIRINKEGRKLAGDIDAVRAMRERLEKIYAGGKIEKEEMMKEESERLKKEVEASMRFQEQLKKFFEVQRKRIKEKYN